MVDGEPRPSPLILAWICLIQVPVLVALPGVSTCFFQLELSLELVSMYSICLDITTIYPMPAWRTPSANQPKRKWRKPLLYCITVLCGQSSLLFHIALLQPL